MKYIDSERVVLARLFNYEIANSQSLGSEKNIH